MTSMTLEAAPSRARVTHFVPALVFLLAALGVYWASVPYLVGIFHDDGVYVLLAKSIATGHGFHYLQLPGTPAATHYPPLYPVALAAVWRLAPSFPGNILALLALNAWCIGLAALGLYQLVRRWFGWGEAAAAAMSLATLLSVPILTLSSALMSEPLFLAGLPPVLLLTQRALERHDRRSALVAGAAVGLLMLVRTHAIAILGAALLLMLVHRDWRRAGLLFTAAVTVQLPWILWCRSAGPVVSGPLNGTYGAYPAFFIEGWKAGGMQLLSATIRANLHELWLLLGDRVWGGLGPVLGTTAALLLVGFLALGAWRTAKRTPLLPTFLLCYFAIIVVMSCAPYRYAWGAWPLLVVLAALGAEQLLAHARRQPFRSMAIVAIAIPALAMQRTEFRGHVSHEWAQPTRNASRAIAPLIDWISRNTPSDATVLVEAPEMTTLFTGRQAAPPTPFTAMEYIVPVRPAERERGLRAMLERVPATYVVTLSPGVLDAARAVPMLHPIDSLPGAAMFKVVR